MTSRTKTMAVARVFGVAIAVLSVARSSAAAEPCVRATKAMFSSPCHCETASFTFSIESNMQSQHESLVTRNFERVSTGHGASGGALCSSSPTSVTIEFAAQVKSTGTKTVSFPLHNPELAPANFEVTLNTCDIAAGTDLVRSATYKDEEGNTTDEPGLLSAGHVPECASNEAAVATASRQLQATEEDCERCSDLTPAQQEALSDYDNGGKRIVCDPTCLDGVTDPLHCNYYGLGQICRGCGDCSDCTPCPDDTPSTDPPVIAFPASDPTPDPILADTPAPVIGSTPSTPVPVAPSTSSTPAPVAPSTPSTPAPVAPFTPSTPAPVAALTEDEADDDDDDDDDATEGDDDGEFDCSACSDLTSEQIEALTHYDNGGKVIVCDRRCIDLTSDPTHCNYFGLGQICRGCGDCSDCVPCP